MHVFVYLHWVISDTGTVLQDYCRTVEHLVYYGRTVPSCCDDSSKELGELPSGPEHEYRRCWFDTEDARCHLRRRTENASAHLRIELYLARLTLSEIVN
jgi:hypothetical protein